MPGRTHRLPPAGRPGDSRMLGARLGGEGYGFVVPPGGPRALKVQGGAEAALREPIPDGRLPIAVDANVAINAMREHPGAFGGTVRKVAIADRYRRRLVIPGRARDEIDAALGDGGGYDAGFLHDREGMYDDSEPDAGCLEGLEGMHRAAAAAPGSREALRWLRKKGSNLPKSEFPRGAAAGDERRALGWLRARARPDREIAAQAAAIAARRGGAYLLTSDGDLLAFRERILGITGGRLDVRRPEAAG